MKQKHEMGRGGGREKALTKSEPIPAIEIGTALSPPPLRSEARQFNSFQYTYTVTKNNKTLKTVNGFSDIIWTV